MASARCPEPRANGLCPGSMWPTPAASKICRLLCLDGFFVTGDFDTICEFGDLVRTRAINKAIIERRDQKNCRRENPDLLPLRALEDIFEQLIQLFFSSFFAADPPGF